MLKNKKINKTKFKKSQINELGVSQYNNNFNYNNRFMLIVFIM